MDKKKSTQFVNVFIRPRPLNKDELQSHHVVIRTTSTDIVIKKDNREKRYSFDRVFKETSPQIEVFNEAVLPLIKSLIEGINCTLFAYGQTGTGKTYTLNGKINQGLDDYVGIIPRAARQIFDEIKNLKPTTTYTVQVSYIEIYNEEIRDLLNESETSTELKIYENNANKGSVKITNLTEVTVLDHLDIFKCLQIGTQKRQTASTNLNRQSSRSHSLFTITVTTVDEIESGEEIMKVGKLNLVDLAGSENIGRSGAVDIRAKEAFNINRSLLTLGKVVQSLAKKQPHVPYRESKLTRILQDSLGGNTKTTMIATISPSIRCWDETVSTLEYATITRGIEISPQVNESRTYLVVIKELRDNIKTLESELEAARSGNGFYVSKEAFQQMNKQLKEYENKNKALSQMELDLVQNIKNLTTKLDNLENENDHLTKSFQVTQLYNDKYKEKLKTKIVQLKETDYLLNYYKDREMELTETTNNLLGVVKTSANHANIFYSKYLLVTDTSLRNANVAKDVITKSAIYFDEVQKNTENFLDSDQNNLNDMDNAVRDLKEVNDRAVKNLEEASNILCSNNLGLKISPEAVDRVHNEVLEVFNIGHSCEEFGNKIAKCRDEEMEIVKHIETKAKASNERYTNALREAMEINKKLMEHNEIMENSIRCNKMAALQLDELLNKLMNNCNMDDVEMKLDQLKGSIREAEEDRRVLMSKINDLTVKGGNVVGDFFSKLKTDIKEQTEGNKMKLRVIGGKINSAKETLHNSLSNGLDYLRTKLGQSRKSREDFSANMTQFYEEATENIKEISKNVKFSTRVGDTPARNTVNLPMGTPKRTSLQFLRNKFKNELNNLSFDDSIDNIEKIDEEEQ